MVGAVKSKVKVPPDKVDEIILGVPGVLEDPPEVTVIVPVGVPKLAPLTALNVIDVGGVPVVEKVPLPCMYEVVGVVVSVMVFQLVPSELY